MYPNRGAFSPTTLRYAKVASDLQTMFGSLNNLDIVEIGGGYGGQCLVLSKLFRWKSYTIIDLSGPLKLTKKYLEAHRVENVTYKTLEELSGKEVYDLAISNFAFSECVRPVQDEYLSKVLQQSKRGYLTCNEFSHAPLTASFSKNALCKKFDEMKQKYQVLPEAPSTASTNYLLVWPQVVMPVDMVVFSYDRPMQLYAFLESVEKYVTGVNQTHVVYRTSNSVFDASYEEVKKRFPSVIFRKQSENPAADFKPLVLSSVYARCSSSPYIIFAVDDIIVKDSVDLKECAAALEREKAWGFFLRLGKNINYAFMMNEPSPCPEVVQDGNMMTWQFGKSVSDWAYSNNVDMTLYRKDDMKDFLMRESYNNPNILEFVWTRYVDLNKKGISFEKSKIVNIPLNLTNPSLNRHLNSYTTQDLLQKFQEGYKIDITPIHGMENNSPHAAYEPVFVMR